jgi:hypothetical protein
MEADWAVEIGAGSPAIEALWTGFVDLQSFPQRIGEIEEAKRLPALAQALLRINHPGAPQSSAASETRSCFWTAKCDLWQPQDCDPFELDATAEEAAVALACYIDLLPRSDRLFAAPVFTDPVFSFPVFTEWTVAETTARAIVRRLRAVSLTCARADLIVRSATAGPAEGFGITAYLTACGADLVAAQSTLAAALAVLAQALSTGREQQ